MFLNLFMVSAIRQARRDRQALHLEENKEDDNTESEEHSE